MTTNELYQAALKEKPYQVASTRLADGSQVYCSVKLVAGCSIKRKHPRTTWHYRPAADEYSKTISHEHAAKLLA